MFIYSLIYYESRATVYNKTQNTRLIKLTHIFIFTRDSM